MMMLMVHVIAPENLLETFFAALCPKADSPPGQIFVFRQRHTVPPVQERMTVATRHALANAVNGPHFGAARPGSNESLKRFNLYR
jgi:hypothetical protein